MRPTLPLVVLMLILPAAAGVAPVRAPTCDLAGLEDACVNVILGDLIIGFGQEEEFNNGTYVVQGEVTVQSGGRLEIDASTTVFNAEHAVTVELGGLLLIDGADIEGVPDSDQAPQPVIHALPGSTIIIQGESTFTAIEVRIATQDAQIDSANTYSRGNPNVRLIDFDGVFERQDFADVTVGINVTRGSPTIQHILVLSGNVGLELLDADITVDDLAMTGIVDTGIVSIDSPGTMMNLDLSDHTLPPTTGIDVISANGAIVIDESSIHDLGTGIRYCMSDADDVDIQDVDYANNGDDTFPDPSC